MTRFPEYLGLARPLAVAIGLCSAAGLASAQPADLVPAPPEEPSIGQPGSSYLRTLGDYFFGQAHYYRAIGTYAELALFSTDPDVKLYGHLRIAMAYHLGGQLKDAVAAYDRTLDGFRLDETADGFIRLQRSVARAEIAIRDSKPTSTDALVAEFRPLTERPGQPYAVLAQFHLARLHLLDADEPAARKVLASAISACGTRPVPDCAVLERLDTALHVRRPARRSPTGGLLLSAILPGAGSAYSRHYVDALYYLGITSLSALGAYDVYTSSRGLDDQKATFYGLATVAVMTYAANLVQGYASAVRFNAVEKHEFRRRVLQNTALPLPYESRALPRAQ